MHGNHRGIKGPDIQFRALGGINAGEPRPQVRRAVGDRTAIWSVLCLYVRPAVR